METNQTQIWYQIRSNIASQFVHHGTQLIWEQIRPKIHWQLHVQIQNSQEIQHAIHFQVQMEVQNKLRKKR